MKRVQESVRDVKSVIVHSKTVATDDQPSAQQRLMKKK